MVNEAELTAVRETKPMVSVEPPTEEIVSIRPLSERLTVNIDGSAWQMSRLLISDPSKLEDPAFAEGAKAEMNRFNAQFRCNARKDGRLENGRPIAEMFASFGSMLGRGAHNFSALPPTDPSDPLQPNWQLAASNGTFDRIHGLIRSSYAASSRPSIQTAVRHWMRFCSMYGISPFRPQVADNWDAKVTEEIILMMFLEYLLFTVGVQ